MTRAEHLFAIIGALDNELVEESASPAPAARRVHRGRWAALAACALLAVGLWNLSRLRMGSSASAGSPDTEGVDEAAVQGDPENGTDYSGGPGTGGETQDGVTAAPPAAAEQPETAGGAAPAERPSGDAQDAPVSDPGRNEAQSGMSDALPDQAGSLAELNEALAAQIAEGGVPVELPIYRDGASLGLYPVAEPPQKETGTAPQLLYAAGEDGLTLPVWRLTLADGSTRDIPAVDIG